MRQAKIDDHWRHIYERKYQNAISKFEFQQIEGIADGEILFEGGITAICGGNGVGKSTLLSLYSRVD